MTVYTMEVTPDEGYVLPLTVITSENISYDFLLGVTSFYITGNATMNLSLQEGETPPVGDYPTYNYFSGISMNFG